MKTLKLFFVGFLVLSFAATLSVPAMGYEIPQEALETMPPRYNPNAMRWGKLDNQVSEVSLKGAPNPDPENIEGDSGSVISSGQEDNIWVYPTGVATIDAENIQYSFDNIRPGGKIHLMAGPRFNPHGKASNPNVQKAFNLGGQAVVLKEDAKIRGEKLPGSHFGNEWSESDSANKDFIIPGGTLKSDRAVIYNGRIAIGEHDVVLDEDCELVSITNSPPKDASIKSLRFEKAPLAAIVSESADEYVVCDNVVTNVVPGIHPTHACEFEYLEAWGIVAIGGYSNLRIATIEHNLVDLFGDDPANDPTNPAIPWEPDYSRADGIMIAGLNPPEPEEEEKSVSILNNTVKNCGVSAMYIISVAGELTVTGNHIVQRGEVGFPNLGDTAWGVGIDMINEEHAVQGFPTKADVQDNTMEGISGHGMFLFGCNESNIEGNVIEKTLLNGKAYKDSLYGPNLLSGINVVACAFNTFSNNIIKGDGAYGIMLQFSGYNTINIDPGNLTGFTPADVSVMPDPWPFPSAHVLLFTPADPMHPPFLHGNNTVKYPLGDGLTLIDVFENNNLISYEL